MLQVIEIYALFHSEMTIMDTCTNICFRGLSENKSNYLCE